MNLVRYLEIDCILTDVLPFCFGISAVSLLIFSHVKSSGVQTPFDHLLSFHPLAYSMMYGDVWRIMNGWWWWWWWWWWWRDEEVSWELKQWCYQLSMFVWLFCLSFRRMTRTERQLPYHSQHIEKQLRIALGVFSSRGAMWEICEHHYNQEDVPER